jgi:hypothetical protein
MAASASVDVRFDGARAVQIGQPGDYVRRPGFWQGGAGIAACWFGGALGIARHVREGTGPKADAHRLAHLGAIEVALGGAAALLREAAEWIDRHPQDNAQRVAMRARLAVEQAASEVMHHAGRAVGAGPLCRDARFAHAMADLPVFLRQSHAERDLAALGQLAADNNTEEEDRRFMDAVERRADPPFGRGHHRSRMAPLAGPGRACPSSTCASWCPQGARAVVVAPHPDDEVLSVGGLLAQLADTGTPVEVIAVTDGTASHSGSTEWPAERLAGPPAREPARAAAPGPGHRTRAAGLARRRPARRCAPARGAARVAAAPARRGVHHLAPATATRPRSHRRGLRAGRGQRRCAAGRGAGVGLALVAPRRQRACRGSTPFACR